MINVKEIIQEYIDLGYSKYDAVILAKSRLAGKKSILSESNKKAELSRVAGATPKNSKRSVVYGSRAGVM